MKWTKWGGVTLSDDNYDSWQWQNKKQKDREIRRAYHDRFKSDIKVSKEIVVEQVSDVPTDKDGFLSMEVDDILNAEKEYSQWRDRDRIWLSKLMDK